MRCLFAVLIALFCAAPLAIAQPSPPEKLKLLAEFTSSLSTDNPDMTEVAYVANRGGVLYTLLGFYLTENGTKSEDKERGDLLIATGTKWITVGRHIDVKINKKGESSVSEQRDLFMQIYANEMKKGKMLNNSVFTELIGGDFKTCSDLSPFFVGIYDTLAAKQQTK